MGNPKIYNIRSNIKMRRILFVFMTTGITLSVHSQVSEVIKFPKPKTVGKVSVVGQLIAELTYSISENNDTIYTLMYNNAEYQHITDIQKIQFSGVGGSIDTLYSRMKSVFSKENKSKKDYEINFMLGKTLVRIKAANNLGRYLLFISGNGYFGIMNNQIDKLFGK